MFLSHYVAVENWFCFTFFKLKLLESANTQLIVPLVIFMPVVNSKQFYKPCVHQLKYLFLKLDDK